MLFSEFTVRNRAAKNRIVRSATNEHLGELDGSVSQALIDLFEKLAAGGTGTIITGHFGVDMNFRAAINQPMLTDDRFIPGAAALAEAAHRHGALICGQISHGGTQTVGEPCDLNPASVEALEAIPAAFAAAARRLKQAGYDAVQVHLAHGYFLASVLDDTLNLRQDAYGGSPEGRFSLVGEVLSAVRAAIGEDMDLWVKLSANNKQLTPYADTLMAYTKMLKAAGVDAIELSGVDFGLKKPAERSYYLSEALAIRSVGVPVILVGGLRERQQMEDILAAGIDMVALSRPLIREPDLPRKLQQGQEKATCIGCNGCMRLYRSEYKNCAFLPPNAQVEKIFGT